MDELRRVVDGGPVGVGLPLVETIFGDPAEGAQRRVTGSERRRPGPPRFLLVVVEQAQSAGGLAFVDRPQRDVVGEGRRQLEQVRRMSAFEFQFDLANRRRASAGRDRAVVDHDQHRRFCVRPAAEGLASELGDENRLERVGVGVEQPADSCVVDRREIELAAIRLLPLGADAEAAGRAGVALDGLQQTSALLAGAHRNSFGREPLVRRVEVGADQRGRSGGPFGFGDQRMPLERTQRRRGKTEFEFDLCAHGFFLCWVARRKAMRPFVGTILVHRDIH